MMLERIALFIF